MLWSRTLTAPDSRACHQRDACWTSIGPAHSGVGRPATKEIDRTLRDALTVNVTRNGTDIFVPRHSGRVGHVDDDTWFRAS